MKKSIMNAINSISSIEEMNEAITLLKAKQKQLRVIAIAEAKGSLKVGQRVKVNGSKGVQYGSINVINRTKAIVNIDGTQWTCPLSLLEVA